MNDDTLAETDEDIVTYEVSDEALEAAASTKSVGPWTNTFLFSPPLPCC
jgi:hypothetical protein